jgi:hypothetical protein
MAHMSNFIISVQELYESGISIQEISEYLNVSLELIENIIEKYCEEID